MASQNQWLLQQQRRRTWSPGPYNVRSPADGPPAQVGQPRGPSPTSTPLQLRDITLETALKTNELVVEKHPQRPLQYIRLRRQDIVITIRNQTNGESLTTPQGYISIETWNRIVSQAKACRIQPDLGFIYVPASLANN